MKIMQVCAYAAQYEGNFMKSLYALENKLNDYGYETVYVFPEKAKKIDWCKKLTTRAKVYFLPLAKARILPKTYLIMQKIYRENPDISIVHSHFELYDIPVTITAPKGVKIFWHLHDPIELGKDPHNIIWRIQYGIVGKKAYLLSVAEKYRKDVVKLGFPEERTATVLNGIDLERIQPLNVRKKTEFDFMTFGWDFYRKGDDIILKACEKLVSAGYEFKMLLNGGESTWNELKNFLNDNTPGYLTCSNPVEDVNDLFVATKVFIQASRRETFSYAICEAAYAGLPVIASDIAGVEWSHELPTIDFFETENYEELFICMKEYLDGKYIAENEISKSRDIIERKYSIECWAENIIGFYEVKND